jgi:hypothetical protein
LAGSYRTALVDRTSLNLYSRPYSVPGRSGRLLLNLSPSGCELVRKIGRFGTGDAPLKNQNDATALLAHYLGQQASVVTFGLITILLRS